MTNGTAHRQASGCRRWLVISGAAFMALFQSVAVLRILQLPADLAAQVNLFPLWEVVASAFWAVVFAYVTVALLRRRQMTLRYLAWSLLAFITYSIVRLFIFTQADYDRHRLPFVVVAAALLHIPAAYLIYSQRIAQPLETENGSQSEN